MNKMWLTRSFWKVFSFSCHTQKMMRARPVESSNDLKRNSDREKQNKRYKKNNISCCKLKQTH